MLRLPQAFEDDPASGCLHLETSTEQDGVVTLVQPSGPLDTLAEKVHELSKLYQRHMLQLAALHRTQRSQIRTLQEQLEEKDDQCREFTTRSAQLESQLKENKAKLTEQGRNLTDLESELDLAIISKEQSKAKSDSRAVSRAFLTDKADTGSFDS
jgi:DNA repair exonuclease SbcCD ATPase subunit